MGRVLVLCCLIVLVGNAYGLPDGAPSRSCTDMKPPHGQEQTDANPYSIMVMEDRTSYTPGYPIKIQIHGPSSFRGILLQARKKDTTSVIGTFHDPDTSSSGKLKLLSCSGFADTAITHTNALGQTISPGVEITWNPPEQDEGQILFIATIAQQKTVWWRFTQSIVLEHSSTPPSTTPTTAATTVTTVTTVTTGSSSTTEAGITNNSVSHKTFIPIALALIYFLVGAVGLML